MMSEILLAPACWAQREFGFVQLGDERRNKRLLKIAQNLAASPDGTLPQAFPVWAELKAAYRFFGQQGVSFAALQAAHVQRTRALSREAGEHLLIEDTTLLDYSCRPATTGLGVIGDGQGRGFELHTTLAVRVTGWTFEQRPEGVLTGLFGQQCSRPTPPPKGERRAQRLNRPRKSQRWAASLVAAGERPPDSQWIYVADREADFYEPMQLCQQQGVDFIIRGYQDRRLADGAGRLQAAVTAAPVLGTMSVAVQAQGGRPARTAEVEVRTVKLDLDGPWRPGGWQPPLREVTVVEVREKSGSEPLHWLLLTSLVATTWSQTRRIIGRYAARWWIEEYHKALKSGTGVEASQLEHGDRLESLIALLAVVAVRLLEVKLLARSQPEGPEAATAFGPELLALLAAQWGQPKAGWNNQTVIIAIARTGGFLARKHDGQPGWQTIWRGWQRLYLMLCGSLLLKPS